MATAAQVSQWIARIGPLAQQQASKHPKTIYPSVCIAQSCIESAWGTAPKMVNANAVFGIKVGSGKKWGTAWKGKSYKTGTVEFYDNKNATRITDYFRAYDSIADSVEDYYDLICNSTRYSNAWDQPTPDACIRGIQKAPYATDPDYVNKVIKIINKYGLEAYDISKPQEVKSVSTSKRILIGHASIDERGKIASGQAGDQTGKEVCTRQWYNKNWAVVLRPKNAGLAEASAQACEKACANNNIGYDQNQRNTAYTQAKKVGYDISKITTPCETDCSALMTLCAIAGGAKSLEYTGNAPTTRTMVSAFIATGMYERLTESKYLTTDEYLKRGDILVLPGSHTVMALQNGSKAVKVTTDGAVQQQTFQQKPSSKYKYTADGKRIVEEYDGIVVVSEVNRILVCGDMGDDVRVVQRALAKYGYYTGEIDGFYSKATEEAVRRFQKASGLEADGECGPDTATALKV